MSGSRTGSGPKALGDEKRQLAGGLAQDAAIGNTRHSPLVEPKKGSNSSGPIDNDPTKIVRIEDSNVIVDPEIVEEEKRLAEEEAKRQWEKVVQLFKANNLTAISHVGRGGQGLVYLAEDNLHRRVGVKILPETHSQNKEYIARFKNEAFSVAKLNHPNIVKIHSLIEHLAEKATEKGEQDKFVHMIVMEFIDGRNLLTILEQEGPMKWSRMRDLFYQVCDAFEAAHNINIIHRDIKPENILVRDEIQKNGTEHVVEKVTVIDFGLAKMIKDGPGNAPYQTKEGEVFGSLEWMPPEQVRGEKVDHRCDIYAVGAAMYHMITGSPPYPVDYELSPQQQVFTAGLRIMDAKDIPKSPFELFPDRITPEASEVIMRCLAKNADDRYQSMYELKNAIMSAKAHTPVPVEVVPLAQGSLSPSPPSGTLSPHSVPDDLPSERTAIVKPLDAPIRQKDVPTIVGQKAPTLSSRRKRLGLAIGGGTVAALALTLVITSASSKKEQSNPSIARNQPLVEEVARPMPTVQQPTVQPDSGTREETTPAPQIPNHTITFRTNVDGVEILRGENSLCTTSGHRCSIDNIAESNEEIVFTFRKNGFRDKNVTVVPSADRTLNVTMEPRNNRPSGTQNHRPQDNPWNRMVPN